MTRTLVLLSLVLVFFAAACCSRPEPTSSSEDPIANEHEPESEGDRWNPLTSEWAAETAKLEQKIRAEQFGTIRAFAKAKMPEVDRTPFLETIANLEKSGLDIEVSPPDTGTGPQAVGKFDLWISVDAWDPEECRAMSYGLKVLNGKGYLSATREGKDWRYLADRMTFDNLPSRFTEPMRSWPLMSPADAINTMLADRQQRQERRKQLDAKRDEAALSSEAVQEREGVLFSVVLEELAKTDVEGSKFIGSPDRRPALTIWPVMPPLPSGVHRFDRVAIGFGVFCTGEPMQFRMPNLVIHKRGGDSWKNAEIVRANISDIRVYNQEGKQLIKPIYELIEGPDLSQFTAKDDNTITCRFESHIMVQPVGTPQYFVVVVRIGGASDIMTLACDLEATPGNITGTVSGQTATSGHVVGQTQVIKR